MESVDSFGVRIVVSCATMFEYQKWQWGTLANSLLLQVDRSTRLTSMNSRGQTSCHLNLIANLKFDGLRMKANQVFLAN